MVVLASGLELAVFSVLSRADDVSPEAFLAACVTHVVVYSLYCSLVIGLICQVECPFAVRISTCHGYQLLVRLLPLDHLGCRVDRWGHA